LREQNVFQPVELPDPDDSPVSVATGWAHSVVITEQGRAYVFGRPHEFKNILRLNRIAKVSTALATMAAKVSNSAIFGNVFGYYPTPTLLANMPPITQVTCSAGLTVLRSTTGELYSFGYNRWEQCGIPPHKKDIIEQPQQILGLATCSKVAAGLQHVIALTTEGQVIGWGKCNSGQLGFGRSDQTHTPPIQISLPNPVIDISAGFLHSAAVTNQGEVYVWGKNMSDKTQSTRMGMLQIAETAWTPRQVLLPDGRHAKRVLCTNYTITIEAEDDGSLWVMGMGELDRNANPQPVFVHNDYVPVQSQEQEQSSSSNTVMAIGQQHVTVHMNDDYRHKDSEVDTAIHRSFKIILHNGEGFLLPYPIEFNAERSSVTNGNEKMVDFSGGWKHDLAIAR
jgi:alpha-tubulin suppressor-like RCC1 family protein